MINKDFKEFIELLNKNNVRYLVVGGYALAFHGHPRYTRNLDIWVWVDQSNAGKIIKALEEFGFSSLDISQKDFLQPGYVVQLGQPPGRIDLLTSVTGLEFETCYDTRVSIDIEDVTIDFIDLESFKKNKRAVGRYQDLADLENLE